MGLMDFLKKGQEKPANNGPQGQQNQSAAPQTDTYTVKKGDSLSKIAGNFYGDQKKWPKIFEANRDQIKDANLIEIGQVLKIPKE